MAQLIVPVSAVVVDESALECCLTEAACNYARLIKYGLLKQADEYKNVLRKVYSTYGLNKAMQSLPSGTTCYITPCQEKCLLNPVCSPGTSGGCNC